MPLFATWILGLVTQIFTSLGLSFSRKVVIGSAAVAAMLAALLIFTVAIKGLLSGIAYALPDWAQPGMMFIPGNAPVCFSSYVSARIAAFVYRYNVETIKVLSYIT